MDNLPWFQSLKGRFGTLDTPCNYYAGNFNTIARNTQINYQSNLQMLINTEKHGFVDPRRPQQKFNFSGVFLGFGQTDAKFSFTEQ